MGRWLYLGFLVYYVYCVVVLVDVDWCVFCEWFCVFVLVVYEYFVECVVDVV